jgi:UTP--glucose-1-phosphate uridylyltransferase
MSIQLAIIPVAGRGTRLLPLTKSQPKEMLPVGRKPVVQHVVEELANCGIRQLLFVTGPGKAAIENHFDIDTELISHLRSGGKERLLQQLAYEREEMEYYYTRQRRQLGLGHAVLCARAAIGGRPFVVALGDSILGVGARSDVVARMTEQFEQNDADAVIALEPVPTDETDRYGIAQPKIKDESSEVFELADVIEKPRGNTAPSNLAMAGRYVCGPKVMEALSRTPPGVDGEIQLTDALRRVIADGGTVLGVRLGTNERRYDIGSFDSYFKAFAKHALADEQFGPTIRQHLRDLLDEKDETRPL